MKEQRNLPSYYKFNLREIIPLTNKQIKSRNKINQKIKTGKYQFKEINCPLCNRDDNFLLSEKDMYGLPVNVVYCKTCGLVYNNPRATEETLKEFYDSDYKSLDRVIPNIEEYSLLEEKKGIIIEEFLKKTINLQFLKDKLILEIGCGAGGLLNFFKKKGYETLGCDFSNINLNYGIKNNNLKLFYGGLEVLIKELKTNNLEIGLIIYEQVFEHLIDIKKELSLLKSIMSKDTLLYISVPGLRKIHLNHNNDLLLYLQFPHLIHYDLKHLEMMLRVSSFKLITGNEEVQAIFRIDEELEKENINFYRNSTLINYLRHIEKKRKMFSPITKINRLVIKIKIKIYRFLERIKKLV